jgi:hypothetical protein
MSTNNSKIATLQQDGNIALLGGGVVVTPGEARRLIIELRDALKESTKSKGFATVAHTNIAKQMFASADDGSVLTVRIPDESALAEIKKALQVESHGLVPVLAALMEFHKANESLNILIGSLAMNGTKYHNYTGQFAQQLAQHTQEFLKIRCIYDTVQKIMGVFCRKTDFDVSTTFKGQLVAGLRKNGEMSFQKDDVPSTYLDYPSMILYTVRKALPEYEVKLLQQKTRFKFVAKKLK